MRTTSASTDLLHLREALRARFPMHVVEPAPVEESSPAGRAATLPVPVPRWSSGVDALDRVLGFHWRSMEGGVVALAGARSCGRTALVRTVLARRAALGESSALVDVTCTFPAASLAGAAAGGRLVVVRPRGSRAHGATVNASWAADQLLRAGVFSLVVLAGCPAPREVVLRRLSGLSRQAGAKVFLLADGLSPGSACAHVRLSVVTAGEEGPSDRPDLLDRIGGTELLLLAPPRGGAPARSARLALEFPHEDRLPSGLRAPDRRPRAR